MSLSAENLPMMKDTSRRNFLKLAGVMGTAAAIVGSVAACGGPSTTTASTSAGSATGGGTVNKNGTIEAGISYALSTGFDPLTSSGATPLAANWHFFEGLTELDHVTLQPYLALAAADPQKVNDTTYRVKIRDGATFHNGSPVTTDDVAYSFTRVIDPANKSLFAQFIPFIDTVKPVDASTVEFTLKYPFPLFATRIAVIKIVPKAVASADQKAFDANPIGSGPYKFVSAAPNDKIVFTRFDAYNGPKPALAKDMTWFLLSDAAARVTAVESGRVAAIEDVPYLDMDRLKSKVSVESVQSFGLLFLMFNCKQAPFSDKRVRQALHYGLDKDKIIKTALLGNATAATSYVPATHPDYVKADTVYTYDPNKAASLLKDAGVSNLQFELLITDTNWVKDVGPQLLESWNKIPGVKVTLTTLQSGALYSDHVDPGNFTVVAAPGDPSVFGNDMDLLLSWYYAGDTWPKNRFRWADTPEYAQVQQKLTAAQQISDAAEQKKTWTEVVNIIADNVPLYPIFHRKLPTAWDPKKLVGFRPLPTTGLSFIGVGPSA